MEAIFNSTFFIALAEMGDKTQLLAFILATRFKKPWAVFAGIFVATILNHLLAAWVGQSISEIVPTIYLKWILALTFIGFALWILIPDQEEELEEVKKRGAFLTTLIAFFLAEMGDKTQLTTVALAAKYQSIGIVTVGTTLGMMITDGLAVFFGDKIAERLSMKWIHRFAALLFVAFGVIILIS